MARERNGNFVYHRPSGKAVDQITVVREACRNLQSVIEVYAPDCREKSLAITKLEEVSMWANKAIVLEDEDSVPTD